MASPEEVDHFDCGGISAPTFTPFCPYWDDICCLWNGSLADQFIDELAAAGYDFDGEARDGSKDYFFQHLATLKKELKHQTPRSNKTKAQAQQQADDQYKVTLAKNHVQRCQKTICEEKLITPDHIIWEALLQLLIAIQTEGQSSDEIENEERDLYHIWFWAWHSKQVMELLKYIDSH
ncbi:hypothetical protein H2248_001562 [Termitomyces sp. 'cryptogamus']|nr:hypothetical protein H2248_001562 [Termitomyces sp. 'cryptogamus']